MSNRTLSPDAFYWFCDDDEDISRYRPGEYHPVKLGDCFSSFPVDHLSNPSSLAPRYRVLHKLGYGSYATIWLARDLLPPGRFVALKIAVAGTGEDSCEAPILRFLAVNGTGIGSQHIVKLLDNFRIQGPNGSHDVFVTEVLVPLTSLARYPVYEKLRRLFIRQALAGVSHLHQHGIAHGDLHLGNLCCTLPGLNEHTEEDLIAHFAPPECTVVLTADPMDQTTSLPPYLVTSISMADYMVNAMPPLPSIEVEPPSLKILDFGNAFHKDQQRPEMQCAVEVRPPEVAFPIVALGNNDPDWDVRSDIWSLGCTIYEIASGSTLFYGVTRGGLLSRMVEMVGQVPPAWEPYWASDAYLQKQNVSVAEANTYWAEHRLNLEKRYTIEEAERLIHLVRSMLVLDPAERPSALQLLEAHSWLNEV